MVIFAFIEIIHFRFYFVNRTNGERPYDKFQPPTLTGLVVHREQTTIENNFDFDDFNIDDLINGSFTPKIKLKIVLFSMLF